MSHLSKSISKKKNGNLAITRKEGEAVTVFGGDIKITVLKSRKGAAVLLFQGEGQVRRVELNEKFCGAVPL